MEVPQPLGLDRGVKHAAESATNVVAGYFINLALLYVLMHWFGYAVQLHESASMGAVFAVVAFVRGYSIRRLFHRLNDSHKKTPPTEVDGATKGTTSTRRIVPAAKVDQ